MDYLIYISEQHENKLIKGLSPELKSVLVEPAYQKLFHHNREMFCFQLQIQDEECYAVNTNYFVGVDWLVPGKAAVYVEPKINDQFQIDFLGMLFKSLDAPENIEHLDNLFHVEYDCQWIRIPEQKDRLSPILIIQFLKLVQRIVQKGLKKSYYRVTNNLNSRVKGKILVGQQIKENIVKNRFTKTICNYQEYGINTEENQFLKLVLEFVSSYLSQKVQFFDIEQNQQLRNIFNYCIPAFEYVDTLKQSHQNVPVNQNVFYKEYNEAIKIGNYILKRFSFNINKTSQSQASTPPFWIDMSKLFELYVFGKLKKIFPETDSITYHDNFQGGKQTDILVRVEGFKCVIDCKYKPRYQFQDPSLEDKRQLAGYTRLKSVYNRLNVSKDKLIRGLIIYPQQDCKEEIEIDKLFNNGIEEYVEFYKLGVKLPLIALPNK